MNNGEKFEASRVAGMSGGIEVLEGSVAAERAGITTQQQADKAKQAAVAATEDELRRKAAMEVIDSVDRCRIILQHAYNNQAVGGGMKSRVETVLDRTRTVLEEMSSIYGRRIG